MSNLALVIMAAGMGSRYGGSKQIDGIGPNNELLMEYSIYDAIRAGFDKVVFIIKPGMEMLLRSLCGDRIAEQVEVVYAVQSYDSLPGFFSIPEGRTKPYGTVHALLAARDYVDTPFAILNADDYYGVEAFRSMHDAFVKVKDSSEAYMMGYQLKNTVSENGTVTRGICQVTECGKLQNVVETKNIQLKPDGTIWDQTTGQRLCADSLVSMNFWAFQPAVFSMAEEYFTTFLRVSHPDLLKAECLLPTMVDDLMKTNQLHVNVISTNSEWFGVTYQADKLKVTENLRKLHESGIYPETLRKNN